MKSIIGASLLLILMQMGWSQAHLVNTTSYYNQVLGGTEDGGVSRNEGYIFVARSTVELKEITDNGKKIILKKGDSLIVNVSSFRPYSNYRVYPIDSAQTEKEVKPEEAKKEERFEVIKIGTIYYLNVNSTYAWPGTITYVYRKKEYTSGIKDGFDYGHTDAAP